MLPAAILVFIELAIAFALSWGYNFHYEVALSDFFLIAVPLSTGIVLIAVVFFLIRCMWNKETQPISRIRDDFRGSSSYIFGIAGGVLLIVLQICALGFTKAMIPVVAGFWADEALADIDLAIFGVDLWKLLQWLPNSAIDTMYLSWAPIKFGSIFVLLALPGSVRKSRALLAYFILFSLGVTLQYALPSAGPIFYERLQLGDRFSGLPFQPLSLMASDYLWQAYQNVGGAVGGGISAFPSIHVATTAWVALTASSYSRVLGVFAYAYLVVIWMGSVSLGWHYFVDGLAGLAIAFLAWFVAGRIVAPSRSVLVTSSA